MIQDTAALTDPTARCSFFLRDYSLPVPAVLFTSDRQPFVPLFCAGKRPVLRIRIRECFDPRIRDPGWKKNPDPGLRMNIPDNFSVSLETVFRVRNI